MIRQEVMIEIIGADWQILAVEYSDLLGIADRYLYERLIWLFIFHYCAYMGILKIFEFVV